MNTRYPALTLISTLFRILGGILAVIGFISLVWLLSQGALGLGLVSLLGAAFASITSFAGAEIIRVVVDIEANTTGQLAQLIRKETGFEITDKLIKDDGRPIFPEEITEKLNKILSK